MDKPRKTIVVAFVLGMLAMGGVLAAAAFGLASGSASAATPGKGDQGTTTATQAQGNSHDLGPYLDLLQQNFAANLGVPRSKVDSSFTAAVNATVDKAVQDGALTQEQANQIKANASSGLGGILVPAAKQLTGGSPNGAKGGQVAGSGDLLKQALNAGAGLMRMTPDDVALAIKRDGRSLTELAQAHGVDPQTLLSTMLAAGKSFADSQVSSGKWQQSEADAAYQDLTTTLNSLMSGRPTSKPANGATK